MIREFQLLVLGYPHSNAVFCGKPIEKFADDFISPVILVGPENQKQFYLNSQAVLLQDNLGISTKMWTKVQEVEV